MDQELRDKILSNFKQINIEDGDLFLFTDIFSNQYKELIRQSIMQLSGNKKNVSVLFIPNIDNIKIIKI